MKKQHEKYFMLVVMFALVGSLSLLSVQKTGVTGQQIKVVEPVEATEYDGYLKDLATVDGVAGAQYCEYKLFKDGAWTGPHYTSRSCSELAQDNRVLG